MIVVGLFGLGMNPGACLVRDGRLIAFAEEERFTRVKTASGLLPANSVAWCLRAGELQLGDVDALAFPWDANKYPQRMFISLAREYLRHRGRASSSGSGGGSTWYSVLSNLFGYTPSRLRDEIRLSLRAQGLSGRMPPLEFVSHHLSHAYSAYFCSPFDQAVVLTIDGSGEDLCTQVAVARGDELRVADSIPIPHSLGWFYAAFTAYLGFKPYRHEGKLMGLAALGHERASSNPWPERLDAVLRVENGSYRVDPAYTRMGEHSFAERFTDALAEFVTRFDPQLVPLAAQNGAASHKTLAHTDPRYVDLAWGVQAKLEAAALAVAARARREHGIANLCIAGGVAQNCKLNGALRTRSGFERVFVQPACNDAGAALGAALRVAQQGGDRIQSPLRHAYWGSGWSAQEIEGALKSARLKVERCDDVVERVADELARGQVVGWFQGRTELGPHALGARSILADPRPSSMREHLNREVKGREPWRPFAPSILSEVAAEHFVDAAESPFMATAFDVRSDKRAALASAMHVDGTARPQIVERDDCPQFHRLLERFHERSGVPYLINTSFNHAGEPIVNSPLDALRTFYSTGLDFLALGDFVLSKK